MDKLVIEGGIRNTNMNSRPIRTRNPFNVGNTDNGQNSQYNDVQTSINAYYDLIARYYLGKGKTASDLISNFVNGNGSRYATDANYEKKLNDAAAEANRIASPIIAQVNAGRQSNPQLNNGTQYSAAAE